jgi:hypothetical protein
MDEFVIVEFPTRRRVDIDGMPNGLTQTLLQVETGHHTFDLNVPVDYTPDFQNVSVFGTSQSSPLRVRFMPRTAALLNIAPTGPKAMKRPKKTPPRARKRSRKIAKKSEP